MAILPPTAKQFLFRPDYKTSLPGHLRHSLVLPFPVGKRNKNVQVNKKKLMKHPLKAKHWTGILRES